ncbi:hypothetical protein COCCADRAFT_108508 [Bipolaris zeicola 26-R-13]|uniref:Uncharacterized protein n=1 Tax=Cochliobolus carbonum (strain 26-R-13) TaxID=930089 RepID=W6XN23_COCC2|nr:uncharacterized protein COCCADRAFT_108508 [Bipolaris zeicola 26-R-13]EUC28687.1 hypothetical protein COCCADRAFT_108508 [Bipolaris zeicola 26-R-13]
MPIQAPTFIDVVITAADFAASRPGMDLIDISGRFSCFNSFWMMGCRYTC